MAQLLDTLQASGSPVASRLGDGLPQLQGTAFARSFAAFLAPGSAPVPTLADLSLTGGTHPLPDAQARLVQALVGQLQADLGTVGRAATGAVKADDWRAHLVPVMNGQHPETVQLYVRQQPDDPLMADDAATRSGRYHPLPGGDRTPAFWPCAVGRPAAPPAANRRCGWTW